MLLSEDEQEDSYLCAGSSVLSGVIGYFSEVPEREGAVINRVGDQKHKR
jgi:hypothetical protein